MGSYDVTALGELLIDFTENGTSAQGNPVLEANPGGAPCNVLAMLCKLGYKTAFIGKIGRDPFGSQLEEALLETGIHTAGLKKDETVHTTLAFVHTLAGGDREFSFYRSPGADQMLTTEDLETDLIKNCRIFHYGSLSMTDEPCRSATREAVAIAGQANVLRSFDPNLREPLWHSLDEAREQISFGMRHCDILKISDNEIRWFTGREDFDEGAAVLQKEYGIPLILLSMGKEGSRAYTKGGCRVEQAAFVQEHTIETTGAGDTFGACALHYVLSHGWHDYSETELKEMLAFANAAASIVTTRKGALRVMPSKEETEHFLNQNIRG